jgi:tellurite resistance protein TerC
MIWLWVGFILFILLLLALDLGVLNRKPHVIGTTEALAWTAMWVVLALAFNVGVYYLYTHHWFGIGREIGHVLSGEQAAIQFFTGYLIEKSLSLDNIFVIALIFAYFRVPLAYQHRVLFWGVLGALVLRGIMIAAGTALIHRFEWMIYVFGALLLITAAKMLAARHDNLEPDRNPLVKLARRLYPVTMGFQGTHFFSQIEGRRAITPLFLVLLIVESMDVLFAVDSIPAIFAITRDPFLVFTSNIFAILGLRSLYFALAGLMERFRYLKMGLVFILAYIGVKMLLSHHHTIPTAVSLAVVGGILTVSALASVLWARRDTAPLTGPISPIPEEWAAAANHAYGAAKRALILIVGSTVILIGIGLLVLPGPGWATICIGLGILAIEFPFARRWLTKGKDVTGSIFRPIIERLKRRKKEH